LTKNPRFTQLVFFLNPVLAKLRQGLRNCQLGKTGIFDDYVYTDFFVFMILTVNLGVCTK